MAMFDFSLPLEEKPIKVIKIHWSAYLAVFLKIVVTGLILFSLLFLAAPYWWQNYYGRIGLLIFLGLAITYLIQDYWKKFLTAYIVTGDSLIDVTQEKILKRVVTEIEIQNIDKIKIKRNFLRKKILNVGEIIFGLKEEGGILVFYHSKNPKEIKKLIKSLVKEREGIVKRKGSECRVVEKESEAEKVPLTFAYYGKKAEEKKRLTEEENLLLVKKDKNKSLN